MMEACAAAKGEAEAAAHQILIINSVMLQAAIFDGWWANTQGFRMDDDQQV